MDTAVVYKSKYGATETYARWIAQELGADLLEAGQTDESKLLGYKTIIYGGGLYASGINGFSLIKKAFPKLRGRRLAVFTVGLADPAIKEQFLPILEKNFTEEMRREMKIFHLRGGMNYRELGVMHKAMMSMVKRSVEKKEEDRRTDEDRQMLLTYGKVVDFTDRDSIGPLLAWYRGEA